MINVIQERDLFQEQEKNLYEKEDLLIITSEEYINDYFKLDPNQLEITKTQLELVIKLFSEIRNDKEYKAKYKPLKVKDGLSIVTLTTTDEGHKNILNYIRDLFNVDIDTIQ